ncbi:Tyrosine-protein kinase ephrin type A/B receptor-like [Cinara cedri]|uniref:Tyrosine-protein kinase ephrin type A/B receptor-like n=1 Tax=Cinara cedri TaxID=506608 RepID=A0A5E4M699_9HEMI|nr:Tyrosine-protein kinase ephrin type A/B receptor-like [Cinara cedri]
MKIFNPSPLFAVEYLTIIGLAAAAIGRATCSGDYGPAGHPGAQIIKTRPGPVRWPCAIDSKTFFGGLFDSRRQSKPKPSRGDRGRATVVHPNDANVAVPDVGDGGGPTVFGDEQECESANDGRPCLCYTPDFFDSVGRLLDEATATFACRSYKAVASVFVVSPSSRAGTTTAVVSAQSPEGTDETATGEAWNEVDFDRVANYRLEVSEDAVGRPIYEIRGSAFYKTVGGCTQEIINPMRKQLPGFVQTEMCPEGSSRYACNVVVESSKCSEDESTLEVNYTVTSNDKAGYWVQIAASKTGRNVLFYQKLLAKITNVLVGNLKKTLSVPIVSKYSMIDAHFVPNRDRMNVTVFVSCAPGFGIHEVFCTACPPHHYSPDKSTDCLKCNAGFHQLVAGSAKCVKCPHLFANGCLFDLVPAQTYYVVFVCFLVVLLMLAVFSVCCFREENETRRKLKSLVKLNRKPKPKVPSGSVPGKFRQMDEEQTIPNEQTHM